MNQGTPYDAQRSALYNLLSQPGGADLDYLYAARPIYAELVAHALAALRVDPLNRAAAEPAVRGALARLMAQPTPSEIARLEQSRPVYRGLLAEARRALKGPDCRQCGDAIPASEVFDQLNGVPGPYCLRCYGKFDED